MRVVWMTLLLTMIISKPALADSESDRINGVAQFLIDRANDNYLYIFEKKIRDDKQFACYFPETRANLDVSGLKQLLYSHDLWNESISKDLNVLATRSIAASIEYNLALSDKSVQLADLIIPVMQGFEVKYHDHSYPLDAVPLNASPELRNLINGFSSPLSDIVTAMNVFRQYKGTSICDMPARNSSELKQQVDALINLPGTMSRFSDYLQQHAGDLVLSDTDRQEACKILDMSQGCKPGPELKTRIIGVVKARVDAVLGEQAESLIAIRIDNINQLIATYQNPKSSMTTKVVMALKVIQNTKSLDPGEFDNMSRYIMFFAQVSDSTSPEEVKDLLAAYTLPSVSFYTKREYGSHWMITSYLGISGGRVQPSSTTDSNNSGIFAPIGIEWSYGTASKNSISVMLAPLDFGYPISLKLNGVQQDTKLNDIIAPSLSLSYGIKDYPLVIGIAYQRGRIIQATGQQERRLMLFVAFDMPLFGLN